MERRFLCIGCGKCCHGMVPLTIADALTHADKFPLTVVWTPVRRERRSFAITAELGITIQLKNRRKAAVQISPTLCLPPSFSCPMLAADGLCGIHASKPQRCRTMPLSGYRDEGDQTDLIIPQADWPCETKSTAPVIYRDKHIVARQDFDIERRQLVQDATVLKPYGEWLLDAVPALRMELQKTAMKPAGGQVLVAFSTLVPRLPKVDIHALAIQQFPLMEKFAKQTAGDPDLKRFHRHYLDSAAEWQNIAAQRH